MKSRLVILSMLVLGMLTSTAGAGLAVSGLSGETNATVAQYGTATPTPTSTPTRGGGGVLGDQDTGGNVLPSEEGGNGGNGGNNGGGGGVQPSRQVEAGANTSGSLPFTGFAAIPILLGGIALLTAGLLLRRRAGAER